MYKSCSFCGKIHKMGVVCPKKEKKKYKKINELDEENKAYKKFLSSVEWQKKREEIKTRDLYLCPICRRQKKYDGSQRYGEQKLEVHHIFNVRKHWDMRLDNYNLITLCELHHREAETGLLSKRMLRDLARLAEGTPPTKNSKIF